MSLPSLVPDAGGDAAAHELTVLVRPFDLVVGVEHQAEAALALVEVLQPLPCRDHIPWPLRDAVGIGLAAVDAGQAHTLDRRRGGRRPNTLHRPGEGIEVARRNDPAPAGGLG